MIGGMSFPMTLGNARANGIHTLDVRCMAFACGHEPGRALSARLMFVAKSPPQHRMKKLRQNENESSQRQIS
jgi:hypothetical protein